MSSGLGNFKAINLGAAAPKITDKITRSTSKIYTDLELTSRYERMPQPYQKTIVGTMKAPRRKIPNRLKVQLLQEVQKCRLEGQSLNKCCEELNIQPSQIRRWKKLEVQLRDRKKAAAASLHKGRASILKQHEEALLQWFYDHRSQGIMVSVKLMTLKAGELHSSFRRKSSKAQDQAVRRFLAANGIVIRVVTHESQRAPETVKNEALDFIHAMRPRLMGMHRNQCFIINMDQTPVFFDMTSGRTLETAGSRTVNG